MSPAATIPTTDALSELLQRAIAISPADETEILWMGIVRRAASTAGKGRDEEDRREETLLVRVRERGRVGTHRTGSTEWNDVEQAIRAALAQARAHEPLPGLPHLPGEPLVAAPPLELWDSAIAALGCDDATALLRRSVERTEQARLRWQSGEILVASSRAPLHRARVTGAALQARSGKGVGEGRASGAGRTLAGLDIPAIVARARARRSATVEGEPGAPPTTAVPVWLAPEAVGTLIHLLGGTALTAHAHRDGSSFLRHLLGTQVFDRRLTLIDDGLDASGLPFPFDLEGAAKRRVELISAGTPRTPALDQRHAALFGMPATGHAVGGDDARAENLFLIAGESTAEELTRAAAGGVFIAELERAIALPPEGRRFVALARGVRRVTADGLGEALADFRIEDSLPRALSHVLAVGSETVLVSPGDPFYGGVRAPALVIDAVAGLGRN